MATSSFRKHFVISQPKEVEKLIYAMEKFYSDFLETCKEEGIAYKTNFILLKIEPFDLAM